MLLVVHGLGHGGGFLAVGKGAEYSGSARLRPSGVWQAVQDADLKRGNDRPEHATPASQTRYRPIQAILRCLLLCSPPGSAHFEPCASIMPATALKPALARRQAVAG